MNPFKNEQVITLAGVSIKLRPDFEAIAALENDVGSVAYLAWKFSEVSKGMKNFPLLTDCAKLIYHCQVKDEGKTFSKEEIWSLAQDEGMSFVAQMTMFLGKMTAGNKMAAEVSEAEKKS